MGLLRICGIWERAWRNMFRLKRRMRGWVRVHRHLRSMRGVDYTLIICNISPTIGIIYIAALNRVM